MKNYKNKVAVITGAGKGIGRGIALYCAKLGMKLVLSDIQIESLNKTAEDASKLCKSVMTIQADVSIYEEVEDLAQKSFEKYGNVDLLINNAGVAKPSTVLESSLQDWNWIMGVNFFGMLHGIKAFVPSMIKSGKKGHVVNVASMGGAIEGLDSYIVSKYAAVALSESLYHDLAEAAPEIAVSIFMPGLVNTELYNAENARPKRFKTSHSGLNNNDAMKDFFQKFGFSVKETVNILFKGLEDNKLYIGPKAFKEQSPKIHDLIINHAENIINERNPKHPFDMGPTNPR